MDTFDSSVADLGNLVHFWNVIMGRNIVKVNQNYRLTNIMYKFTYFFTYIRLIKYSIKVTDQVTRDIREL